MLDEVDKLGRDFRGDPAAALLEILDPEQNRNFRDNYLDLPFDLSRVMFITTANALDTIPRPLLDRMELLRLPGYSSEEKAQIARRYLIPRQLKETGLSEEQCFITDEALRRIISEYTREAGVRQLERAIGRVARKVALRYAEGNATAVTVGSRGFDRHARTTAFLPGPGAQGTAARSGDGPGLDRKRRRRALRRSHSAARQSRSDSDGTAWRGDAGIGESGSELYLVSCRRTGNRSRTLSTDRRPHPRSGGRDSERRPVGRSHHGHGACVGLHEVSGAQSILR